MSWSPASASQRNAAYVPPKSTLPLTMLSPTATLPSAETPQTSLMKEPPGRSPRPWNETCALALETAAPSASARIVAPWCERASEAGRRAIVGASQEPRTQAGTGADSRRPAAGVTPHPPPSQALFSLPAPAANPKQTEPQRRRAGWSRDEGQATGPDRGRAAREQECPRARAQVHGEDIAREGVDGVAGAGRVEPQRDERAAAGPDGPDDGPLPGAQVEAHQVVDVAAERPSRVGVPHA